MNAKGEGIMQVALLPYRALRIVPGAAHSECTLDW